MWALANAMTWGSRARARAASKNHARTASNVARAMGTPMQSRRAGKRSRGSRATSRRNDVRGAPPLAGAASSTSTGRSPDRSSPIASKLEESALFIVSQASAVLAMAPLRRGPVHDLDQARSPARTRRNHGSRRAAERSGVHFE